MKCDSEYTVRLEKPKWDYIKKQNIWSIPVPCGKCYNCIRRRIDQWVFRLKQENLRAQEARFVTLTYSNEHCPVTSYGNMTLRPKHLQKFFKRLRYYHNQDGLYDIERKKVAERLYKKREPIKYYAVGEYGEETHRPHYHMIIFNVIDKCIEKAWRKGIIHIDDANNNTMYYTLKYMEKKEERNRKLWYDKEIEKEFARMSKGIGSNYINDTNRKWHAESMDRNYLPSDGFKIAMPKFYRKDIFTPEQRNMQIGYIKQQVEEAEKQQRKEDGENADKMELSRKKARENKLKNKSGKRRGN